MVSPLHYKNLEILLTDREKAELFSPCLPPSFPSMGKCVQPRKNKIDSEGKEFAPMISRKVESAALLRKFKP